MKKTNDQTQNIWWEFTGKYSLQKTLRFELKPLPETAKWLKINNVFKKDLNIKKSYNQAKFYFDKLHQDFIRESLSLENNVKKIDFENFAIVYEKNKKIISNLKKEAKKNKYSKNNFIKKQIVKAEDQVKKQREKLYKEIVDLFHQKAEEWKKEYQNKEIEENNEKKKIKFSKSDLQQKGTEFLTCAGIINILKYKFPKEKEEEFTKEKGWPSLFIEDESSPEKKIYIFESFEKFTTYLQRFQQTRKNLYKHDGTNTAVATRIVSNFEKFLTNKNLFEEKYQEKVNEIGINNEEQKIFQVDYYYNCLLQEGIDNYNRVIGEINKKVKEYRDKKKIDKKDLPLFINLEKQILGEVKKERNFIEPKDGKTEKEVFVEKFIEFVKENKIRISIAKKLVRDFTAGNFEHDYQRIYLKKNIINEIVYRWFSNPIEFLLKLSGSKSEEKINLKKFTSLEDFKSTVLSFDGEIYKDKFYKTEDNPEAPIEKKENGDNWKNFLKIWQFEFDSFFKDKFEIDDNSKIKKDKNGKPIKILWGYTDELEKEAKNIKCYSGEKEQVKIIKNYCDAVLRINRMMRYFNLASKDQKDIPADLSTEFYNRVDEYFKEFSFSSYYDGIRNFVTQKPSDKNKIKLNFESGILLTGFDINKESEKLGIIFRDKNKYYLGILNKKYNKIFDKKKHPQIYEVNENYWEKMELKLFPNPTRMIPKIAFAKSNLGKFGYTPEIGKIKKAYQEYQKQKIKEKKFDRNKLIKLIQYYQYCLETGGYKKTFDFRWKSAEEYESILEFYDDIKRNSYKIKFVPVNKNYIDKKVEEGKLYLFEIFNKDFSPNSKGKYKNIHSLYFFNLFSDININLENPVFRIGANAEIFYRQASLKEEKENRGIHKKREIIKYKRYTQDKILFHLPIEINSNLGEVPTNKEFNRNVNNFLKDNFNKINIIGIDRGERNLLYYCVINQNQEILDYGSLNEINGVNYFEKLIEREKQRQLERQSWEPAVKIKDLKEGYLSYVIKKICDLIIEHNAIVVLEDLSRRFKQIRGGIERTIYQQFEKALINKLNYLVFKDNRDAFSPGGVLKGYQLTAPFTSFQDIEKNKQTGILFYVSAEYTSQTDPLTGFRKNIYISNSAPQEKIKGLIFKLKEFGWSEEEKSYFIKYNQFDFIGGEVKKDWIIWAKVPRIIRWKESKSSYWSYKNANLNEEFKDFLEKYNFETKNKDILTNLKKRIKEGDRSLSEKKEFDGKLKNFYERFIFLFNLIFQVRNTFSQSIKIDKEKNAIKEIDYGIDFFASPVKPFFTTLAIKEIGIEKEGKIVKDEKRREIITKENFDKFKNKFKNYDPNKRFDADGVGAYNIARKGLIILKKIKENPDNPNLYVSQEEWDKFVINEK